MILQIKYMIIYILHPYAHVSKSIGSHIAPNIIGEI